MSRIGGKPIRIPSGVDVAIQGGSMTVKGPGGSLTRNFRNEIRAEVKDGHVLLTPAGNSKFIRSLWGTYGAHVRGMIAGVVKPFVKKLIIEGIGYKAELKENELMLSVGFSHKVNIPVPSDIRVVIDKGVITLLSSNKDTLGEFAAKIRATKKPEPYKGKGIRYENEVIR